MGGAYEYITRFFMASGTDSRRDRARGRRFVCYRQSIFNMARAYHISGGEGRPRFARPEKYTDIKNSEILSASLAALTGGDF